MTGSAFAINAIVEADRVEYEGAVQEAVLPTPSGKGQAITKCTKCGVAIFSIYPVRKVKLLPVKAGTPDDLNACPPDVNIFTANKIHEISIAPDIPAYDGF